MLLAPTYPVATARLDLRPLQLADVDALLTYRSRADVCRYVPFEPQDRETLETYVTTVWSRHSIDDEGQNLNLGVLERASGELVGDVMLRWYSKEHLGGEIGYVFHPDVAGRGFATEAMHAVVHLAFDDLELHRLIARVDARNAASSAVCGRLAMRREAHLLQNEWFKGEWTDEIDYGLLRDEWDARVVRPGECPRCAG
ncbi:MAG: GNAT family N-acetyltransferase [Frankiaceae bacterium]|nr:GNAT family N-acetyltransferase [Frankiaceae bacterium]MBV9870413.1 GNAT family N-acetyltransferase [Frankiaceae bacterium]